jgi:replicative superfamily II helicase
MTLFSAFIGINKHVETTIPELTGATRDATALWALFTDALLGKPIRLLDEAATATSIRDALDQTIGKAGPEDWALFYFAGHGSPAYQLIPYDTQLNALTDTTIPMSELAERLNASKARVVVIILDCCHSGAAPARVLSDIPVPRGILTTVTDLQGNGRVIIAACKDNESAYEYRSQGLLTQALLQVFKSSENGVDIGSLTDDVTKRVRAEASRFGWQQTPVIFHLIEGGMKFPPLLPGATYAKEFPELGHNQVSDNIHDLAAFGIHPQVLQAWSAQFEEGLNSLQKTSVNEYRILDGQSVLVVAPTSSGKTFVGEMAAAKAIAENRKAVFLLPFKALTNEKFEDFQALYGDQLGLRVVCCTGDRKDDTNDFVRGRYDLALLTYETFLNLSVGSPSLLSAIGLVVLDEAQFITDPTRGINVELLLTNLLVARAQGIEPQIVALSAVIGDVNHFDDWLGCKTLLTHERPIPLIEGVLDRQGTFQYLGADGNPCIEQLLSPYSVIQRRDKPGSQDIIVPLVKKLIPEGEQVLIFRNDRGSTVGCANYLAKELGLSGSEDVIAQLPTSDPSESSTKLRTALSGGTAFHNSDLVRDERIVIEQEFRKPNSRIRVLAATTTVAAGVNTPASTVIIVDTFFYGDERRDFTVAEYKNMAGRAGRLGLCEQGRSILIADTPTQRDHLFNRYVKGQPEPISSSFDPKHLETWVLRLLSQVEQVPRSQVVPLLARTYGGYLLNRKNPNWSRHAEVEITALLQKMESLGLVEAVEDDFLRLSLLGQACGQSNFLFRSAMNLVALLKQRSENLTAHQLMALIQATPEVGGYTSIFKKGHKESVWQRHVTQHYGVDVTSQLQYGAKDNFDYYARCKRAAILWSWIRGDAIEAIEQQFSVTPYAGNVGAGDIRSIADRTRLYLRSAFKLADVLLLGMGPNEEDIDILLTQLEIGLPAKALDLLSLPFSLSRGEYLALYNAGYITAESCRSLSTEQIQHYFETQRVEQVVALVLTKDS